jgi:predicted esterase
VPRALTIETTTHGRVLFEPSAETSRSRGLIVAFHGYGQAAEDILEEVRRVPGAAGWTLVSVQGLHRFYARDNQRVVASWMTRQDRAFAIADNIAYVDRAVAQVVRQPGAAGPGVAGSSGRLVFLGFSQGVAMAYRAALSGAHDPAGIIALGGDIPPELRGDEAVRRPWPPVLLATGSRDAWFTPTKLVEDARLLESRGSVCETLTFDGGHEWTDQFRARAGRWLEELPDSV